MRVFLGWLLLFLGAWLSSSATAHEVRPGLLQLTEAPIGQFEVLWKVPARGERVFSIEPVLPEDCQPLTLPVSRLSGNVQLERWGSSTCPRPQSRR